MFLYDSHCFHRFLERCLDIPTLQEFQFVEEVELSYALYFCLGCSAISALFLSCEHFWYWSSLSNAMFLCLDTFSRIESSASVAGSCIRIASTLRFQVIRRTAQDRFMVYWSSPWCIDQVLSRSVSIGGFSNHLENTGNNIGDFQKTPCLRGLSLGHHWMGEG